MQIKRGISMYAEIVVGILSPTTTPAISAENILMNGVNDNLNLVAKINFLHVPFISV